MRTTFVAGASDRWTYRLRAELPSLTSGLLPQEALTAEIRRIVDRGDTGDRDGCDGTAMVQAFEEYRTLRKAATEAQLLTDFVTLCQSASFMARGHE